MSQDVCPASPPLFSDPDEDSSPETNFAPVAVSTPNPNPHSNQSSSAQNAPSDAVLHYFQHTYRMDPLICLIDMDCFYVQVELRLAPEWRGKPTAVVQYKKDFRGGGLIAVSYESRARGVKRGSRGSDAVLQCADLHLFAVPELNGKADLTRYREAGAETIKVMMEKFKRVERASIDEAFIDLTEEVKGVMSRYVAGEVELSTDELVSTCVPGVVSLGTWLDQLTLGLQTALIEADIKLHLSNLALAIGAKLIKELRDLILEKTQFHCSAGISFSKTLSKLACCMNKPRKQTILPINCVSFIYQTTLIKDVRFLGGKLGEEIVSRLGITTMAELSRIDRQTLFQFFDFKTIEWLRNICQGRDGEVVQARELPKSIGCSKNFMGPESLKDRKAVQHWMRQFSVELEQRLKKDRAENNRTAEILTVYLTWNEGKKRKQISRNCRLVSYDREDLAKSAFDVADRTMTALGFHDNRYDKPLITMGITAAQMVEGKGSDRKNRIENYFGKCWKVVEEEPKPEAEEKKREESEEEDEKQELVGLSPPLFEPKSDDEEEEVIVSSPSRYIEVTCAQPRHWQNCAPSTSRGHPGSASYQASGESIIDLDLAEVHQRIADLEADDKRVEAEIELAKNVSPTSSGEIAFEVIQMEDEGEVVWKEHECDKCGKKLTSLDMESEHVDYHVAKDLAAQFAAEFRDPNRVKRKLTIDGNPMPERRKAPAGKKSATKKVVKKGPMDKFFTKM